MGMKLKSWQEVLTADLPRSTAITQKTVATALEQGRRYRGSMRIASGRIWTDADFEHWRAKVLATPLP